MPPQKKRDKFLDGLSRLLFRKVHTQRDDPREDNPEKDDARKDDLRQDETRQAEARQHKVDDTDDGPSRYASSGGVFNDAREVALNNAVIASVQGDYNTLTYVHGDHNLLSHVMDLLLQHTIPGATHDSSVRSPPPRCHPQTRVKLLAHITTWFDGQGREELVLWLTGPAGVGKSAIVQTFAEYLVKFDCWERLCSSLDQTNLAARIEAYSDFVVKRLSRDPQLLSGDMQAQFKTFIVEPFVEKKIGAGSKRWGILLDGLDELKGEDAQCEIIRLVTPFAHDHPDVPLLWVIASRPESHISDIFDDNDVPRSYWSEYIPIDSTETCADVDRFLRAGFDAIRKKFWRSFPRDWPNDTDFLKLTAAASGLFIYAEVVMHFIRDPEYSDPVSRFKILLSVIDRSNATPTTVNPFAHLDTLYHAILSSIPSNLWPTAKRLLRCSIYWDSFVPIGIRALQTLRGMAILLDLPPHVIYACLMRCQSILHVPEWKVAHEKSFTFLHASFSDYLRDTRRSGEFHVGSEEDAENDMHLSVLTTLNECSRDNIGTVENAWNQHCLKLDDDTPSNVVTKYHAKALRGIASYFAWRMASMSKARVESSIYARLRNAHMIKVSYHFRRSAIGGLVMDLMEDKVETIGLLRHVHLKDLKFGHLDCKLMSPVHVSEGKLKCQPRSETALKEFVSELECLQRISPELEVVIFGGVPKERVAAFRIPLKDNADFYRDFKHYVIPYPE